MVKKKIMSIIFVAALIFIIPLNAYAAEYGNEYPSYLNYSGGAYIEVQSSIGRGTLILPNTYKSNYIGFYGNGYNLCNLSNSTLTGRFVLQNGTTYTARFNAFSTSQYYYESGMTREYRDLSISKIYNTNCDFIDETTMERYNLIDYFSNDSN